MKYLIRLLLSTLIVCAVTAASLYLPEKLSKQKDLSLTGITKTDDSSVTPYQSRLWRIKNSSSLLYNYFYDRSTVTSVMNDSVDNDTVIPNEIAAAIKYYSEQSGLWKESGQNPMYTEPTCKKLILEGNIKGYLFTENFKQYTWTDAKTANSVTAYVSQSTGVLFRLEFVTPQITKLDSIMQDYMSELKLSDKYTKDKYEKVPSVSNNPALTDYENELVRWYFPILYKTDGAEVEPLLNNREIFTTLLKQTGSTEFDALYESYDPYNNLFFVCCNSKTDSFAVRGGLYKGSILFELFSL